MAFRISVHFFLILKFLSKSRKGEGYVFNLPLHPILYLLVVYWLMTFVCPYLKNMFKSIGCYSSQFVFYILLEYFVRNVQGVAPFLVCFFYESAAYVNVPILHPFPRCYRAPFNIMFIQLKFVCVGIVHARGKTQVFLRYHFFFKFQNVHVSIKHAWDPLSSLQNSK